MTKARNRLFIALLAACLTAGLTWMFTAPPAAALGVTLSLDVDDGDHRWSDSRMVPYDLTIKAWNGPATGVMAYAIVPLGARYYSAGSTPGWNCTPNGNAGSMCGFPIGALQADTPKVIRFSTEVDLSLSLSYDLYAEFSVSADGLDTVTDEDNTPGYAVPACLLDFVTCAEACFVCYFLQFDPACAWLASPFQTTSEARRLGSVPGLLGSSSGFTIYRLRDRVLSTTRGGRRATDLYYEHSPAIVAATLGNQTIMTDAVAGITAWVDAMAALVEGRGGEITITQGQIDAVNTFLDNLRGSASGALAATIDRERANLDINGLVGKTMDDLMAEIELLSCEGYETTLFCGELTGDCAVTASDALFVLQIAVGLRASAPQADTDGNGSVTASDALRTLRIAVGSLPATSDCNP